MSLKAFHLVFITASTVLAFGFAVWELRNYWSVDGRLGDLLFGVGSILAGVGLIVYERYFLRELKDVEYL
jgi:hypothetical protein